MSTVFYNLIAVTGSRVAVQAFCADARRAVSGKLAKIIGARQVDWSFEHLFRRHPELARICGSPPCDDGHYLATAQGVARWGRYSRARFRLEVKNYEIHEVITPMSRFYPALCFVNAELCLYDSTVQAACAHRGRRTTWSLPETQSDAHWRRAARRHKVKTLDEAYEDDDVRHDAELGMLKGALSHWDQRVRAALTRIQ